MIDKIFGLVMMFPAVIVFWTIIIARTFYKDAKKMKSLEANTCIMYGTIISLGMYGLLLYLGVLL